MDYFNKGESDMGEMELMEQASPPSIRSGCFGKGRESEVHRIHQRARDARTNTSAGSFAFLAEEGFADGIE